MGVSSISHIITNISDGLRHYILQRIAHRLYHFNRTFNHKSTWTNSWNACPTAVFILFFLSLFIAFRTVWPQQFNNVIFFSAFVSGHWITWKLWYSLPQSYFFSFWNIYVRWLEFLWVHVSIIDVTTWKWSNHPSVEKMDMWKKCRKLFKTQLKFSAFGRNVSKRTKWKKKNTQKSIPLHNHFVIIM